MKLGLRAYQGYFQVYVDDGPWGLYFQALFDLEMGQN